MSCTDLVDLCIFYVSRLLVFIVQDVTPEVFLAVIQGQKSKVANKGTGRVLKRSVPSYFYYSFLIYSYFILAILFIAVPFIAILFIAIPSSLFYL